MVGRRRVGEDGVGAVAVREHHHLGPEQGEEGAGPRLDRARPHLSEAEARERRHGAMVPARRPWGAARHAEGGS